MDALPAGYALLSVLEGEDDVNEKAQQGDIYWDAEDEEWLPFPKNQIGKYVRDFCVDGVARKVPTGVNSDPKPTVTVKRLKRTRR